MRLIVADALDGLARLPAESVHCIVTSPPYWGLRLYSWGGDPKCAHAWPDPVPLDVSVMECSRCGCKAGTLGLEATPDCGRAGMLRLRRDLTEDQRAAVVLRLLSGARPDAPRGDKDGKA